jgi:hypothetical protein
MTAPIFLLMFFLLYNNGEAMSNTLYWADSDFGILQYECESNVGLSIYIDECAGCEN